MPTLQEELTADLIDAVEGYEQAFEWNGAEYSICRTNQPTDLAQVDGGFMPGIGSANKPGIDFSFTLPLAIEGGVRGVRSTAGVFSAELPGIGDLCNEGANQIKNVGGDADPKAVSLTIFAGSPDR